MINTMQLGALPLHARWQHEIAWLLLGTEARTAEAAP
jgi:hypothetical protein